LLWGLAGDGDDFDCVWVDPAYVSLFIADTEQVVFTAIVFGDDISEDFVRAGGRPDAVSGAEEDVLFSGTSMLNDCGHSIL